MPVVPIKFRCFRCNQLLGVKPSKAGSVVACPNCATELIVPDPAEPSPETAAPSAPAEPSPDTGISLDLLDIRPEDIRAEPGHSSRTSKSSVDLLDVEKVLAPSPPPPPPEVPSILDIPVPIPSGTPLEPIIPPIRIESSASRRSSPRAQAKAVRSSDLVIPRSVVAAWSLFVLLALALAFIAGLLAGHFVWKVH